MYNETKMLAYSQWHNLLTNTSTFSAPEDRYDELLRLADDYRSRGIINAPERNTLIEIATAAYTRSVTAVTPESNHSGIHP
ncbi:hypothetical protein [Pseudomonas fluorescens]|nr:hypothetical protein [Pseudomonas fluorescens]